MQEPNGVSGCRGEGNTITSPLNTKSNDKKNRVNSSKHWCFTFNNYKSEDIDTIIKCCVNGVINYIFQEETGKNGTKHLQGYLEFPSRVRPMSIFSMFKGIHWEKSKGSKQENIVYCSKEDTRTGKIYTNIKLPKPIKTITNLYPWQLSLKNILLDEPNERTIYWIHEKVGNTGKSAFSKYMCYHHDAIILSGKASDMKYGIMSFHEKKGYAPEIIIIDVPRTANDYLSYTGIEEVKNGCFFSSKYESGQFIMNCPHLVIFSNQEPDYESISNDRWRIAHLSGGQSSLKWEKRR